MPGLMEAAAQFTAYVIIAIAAIVYARLQRQQGVQQSVKDVTRQMRDPTSEIGSTLAESKQEARRESENWFESVVKAQFTELKQENHELRETIDGMMLRIDDLVKQNVTTEHQRLELQKRVDEAELAQKKAELAADERKLDYQKQLNDQKAEYTSNNTKLQEQLTLMIDENKDVILQRDHAMLEVKRLSERVTELETKIQAQEVEIQAAKARESTLLLVLEKFQVVRVEEKSNGNGDTTAASPPSPILSTEPKDSQS